MAAKGKAWEQALQKRHEHYLLELVPLEDAPPPGPGEQPWLRERAVCQRTWPEVRNDGDLPGGRGFRGVYTGHGPPDFYGTAGPLSWVADAKEHEAPKDTRKDGGARSDRWKFDKVRPMQAADFDRAERQGPTRAALLYWRHVLPGGRDRAYLIPWTGVMGDGRTLRAAWWAWWRHHAESLHRQAACLPVVSAEDGLSGVAVADLVHAALYAAPASQFDYLDALTAWMVREKATRAARQRAIPVPPSNDTLRGVLRMATELEKRRKAAREADKAFQKVLDTAAERRRLRAVECDGDE